MKKRLNLKFIACLLALAVLLGGGMHVLHGVQVRNNAAAFLKLADEAERQGDHDKAARYLGLYLAQDPSDTDALARLGTILANHARTPRMRLRAFLTLDQALRREPERHAERKLLVRQAMHPELGRYGDAKSSLEHLVGAFPKDGELRLLLGECEEGLGKYEEAAKHYAESKKLAPGRVEAYVRLADVQRLRLKNVKAADQAMADLLAANAGDFKAWLAHARYLRVYAEQEKDAKARKGMLTGAREDIQKARGLAAKDADVLLESAALDLGSGEVDGVLKARKALELGLGHYPKDARFYLALSRVLAREDSVQDGVDCLRRGLKELPDDRDLLWSLAHLVIQGGELQEAGKIGEKLRRSGFPPALLDCLEARILFQKGEWVTAIRRLEKVRPQLARSPEVQLQADLLLGMCYGRVGDSAAQVVAYRRALAADPLSEPACLGMGDALAAQGEYAKAFQAYRPAAGRSAAARYRAAQALILLALAQPAGERRWDEADQFLKEIERTADGPQIALLRAEVLAGQGRIADAVVLLKKASDRDKEAQGNAELWVARAVMLQRQEKWADALALLDEAEAKVKDRVELLLARARLWAQRGGDEAKAALGKLTDEADKATGKDWQRLARGLAEGWARLGDGAAASLQYARLAEKDPANLGLRITLFDLALQRGEDRTMRDLVEEMRRIEGEEGALWRFAEARRQLRLARAMKRKPGNEVHDLLEQVAARRAAWPRLALAYAEYEELSGRPDAALTKYQQAIDGGERDPQVIGRAAVLLRARGRMHEVDDLLQKLQGKEGLLLGSLGQIAAERDLSNQATARALVRAEKLVPPDSKDYRELLWLGQMLSIGSRDTSTKEEFRKEAEAKAEAAFRRAVALAEKAPETWVTLVHHLVRTGKKGKAEELLPRMRDKLADEHALLALGQCHEILDRNDKAGEYYGAALRARPQDPLVLRNAARFALRTRQAKEAEGHLKALIALGPKAPEDAAWARRLLAVVLVAGGREKARGALAVLGITDEAKLKELTGNASEEEERARAIVLAGQHNRRQRLQAIEVVERLVRKHGRPGDRFLLAQLCESVGEHRKADVQMLTLLAAKADNPAYLAEHIQHLIGRKRADEAAPYLDRLKKVQPDAFRTARLEALVLYGDGKNKEGKANAVKLLTAAGRKRAGQAAGAAVLLEHMGERGAAKEMYEAFAAGSKDPRAALVLAAFLGRQGETDQALRLCAAAWKDCPPDEVAYASLEALQAGKATPAQRAEVGRQLEAALRARPGLPSLVSALAALRRQEENYDEAIRLYRAAIKLDPRDPLALNNLAWLLSLKKGEHEEALATVEQAIAAAGPLAALLDTRGVIRVNLKQFDAAVKDLEDSVADSPGAGGYFHLAQAYEASSQRTDALRAWGRATRAGLRENILDPLEAGPYRELAGKLGGR